MQRKLFYILLLVVLFPVELFVMPHPAVAGSFSTGVIDTTARANAATAQSTANQAIIGETTNVAITGGTINDINIDNFYIPSFQNLKITAAGHAVTTYNITFDSVVLNQTVPARKKFIPITALTLDVSTSGVNGLDTGSLAANTWYGIYVIYNPTTNTTASLYSASFTAPTLPSGYTYFLLVGAGQCESIGPTTILAQYQIQNSIWQQTYGSATNGPVGIKSAVANTYESLSLAVVLPPIAKTFSAMVFAPGGQNLSVAISPFPGSGNYDIARHDCLIPASPFYAGFDAFGATCSISNMPLPTAQTIYFQQPNTTSYMGIYVYQYTF